MKKGPSAPITKAEFRAEVAAWAVKIRVEPRQIRLQRMRKKWGSCSTSGALSFNADVLALPKQVREYIIVHELLHLKVRNHGKLFKSLLRAYLPDADQYLLHQPRSAQTHWVRYKTIAVL